MDSQNVVKVWSKYSKLVKAINFGQILVKAGQMVKLQGLNWKLDIN